MYVTVLYGTFLDPNGSFLSVFLLTGLKIRSKDCSWTREGDREWDVGKREPVGAYA